MSDLCGSCAHWDSAERATKAPTIDADGRYGPRAPVPGEWGTCERIIRYDLDEPTDDPAYLADGSGYFASLTTRVDFGCALHAQQPPDPDPEGPEPGG